MGPSGIEPHGLVANATGMRRVAVLAGLLACTWAAMVVTGTFVGVATAEFCWLLHQSGPFASNASEGVFEHFVSGWWSAVLELLGGYRVRDSGLLTTLLWVGTLAGLAGGVALAGPVVGVRLRSGSGVPLRWAIFGGGLLGGGLGVGCVLSLLEAIRLAVVVAGGEDPTRTSPWAGAVVTALLVVAWVVTGLAWASAFRRGGSRGDPNRVGRFVRWLFAGSCVELALAAPTYAIAARRESCYCSLFSWFAILVGTAVLTVLCGPMVVLLRTREARLQWVRRACGECGYPARTGSTVCPECGARIMAPAAASLPA